MSYITCLPALYLRLQTKKGTLQTVRLASSQVKCTTFAINFGLPYVCPSVAPLVSTVYIYTFFSCFGHLFVCFTQFGDSTHCLNFVKFHDTGSFKKVQSQKRNFFLCHERIHCQRWSQQLMLSESLVCLPHNKLFHSDIFVKQKQKAYSCFSLLNQWKNLCQLIAWILSNSNCL